MPHHVILDLPSNHIMFVYFSYRFWSYAEAGEGVIDLRFQEYGVSQLYVVGSKVALLDVASPFLYLFCQDLRLGVLVSIAGNPYAKGSVSCGWMELPDCVGFISFVVCLKPTTSTWFTSFVRSLSYMRPISFLRPTKLGKFECIFV